jgi:hypothetical protein
MGIKVLRHSEGLATGAEDGVCSSMLPEKMLLHPVIGGEGEATDWAGESPVLRPGRSLHHRTRSTQRSSSWTVSIFILLKGNFSTMHSKNTQYHSSN